MKTIFLHDACHVSYIIFKNEYLTAWCVACLIYLWMIVSYAWSLLNQWLEIFYIRVELSMSSYAESINQIFIILSSVWLDRHAWSAVLAEISVLVFIKLRVFRRVGLPSRRQQYSLR